MNKIIYKEESYKIIGSCMKVHRTLGAGFLEPVYQEAVGIQFEIDSIPHVREKELVIKYMNRELEKRYKADFVCFDKIILELKALSSMTSDHESQVLNYLKATGYKLGLLVNFGASKLEYKRLVL
ncbi:MAG: GxxExxY protein [Candidatus Marinimicrobia bacterium]|uniref:GxxExxY protein n=1 Tax=Desulfobacula sp. TaxID=2593537 RepID=UPI0019CCA4B0|nr:GxxExxY protein [Candidatus Neomarinimicrobiota bacterium]MBL6996278.1 GxxExxY protein [Desulfobacula sp.]